MGKNIEQPEFKKEKKFITSCIFRVKSEPAAFINVLVALQPIKSI